MAPESTATALSLGRRVVRALATARSVDDAVSGVVGEIAEALGFSVGVLWLLDERTGLLRWSGEWAHDGAAVELRDALRRLTFAPGVGLPGEAFASVAPRWIADVDRQRVDREEPRLPRADVILAAGLRGIVDVPVVSGSGAIGVMEFFSAAPREPTGERVDAIAVVGQQLAEYLTRVRVEERLRVSEASSASIVRAALDCIITMDHRGRVVDFNPAAETVFGYDREAVIGERLADLIIPPHLRDAHQTALRTYIDSGRPTILDRRLELEGMRADGSMFPVELTVTRLGLTSPPVFAGFIRDITDRREAEEELTRVLTGEREARVRAEQAEAAARRAADALQRSLLPPHLPAVPGLELGAAYRAGAEGWEVGGDFYDVFELEEGRWALVIGDVCGKGVDAAALTAKVRYAIRAAAVRHRGPSDVLAALNATLLRDAERGAYCTVIYATVDVRGGRPVLCLAAGGHPLPLVASADGAVRSVGRSGTLIGGFPTIATREEEVELGPGDLLVLYTDGVTEAHTDEGLFGVDRIAQLLADCDGVAPAEVARRIEQAVLVATTRAVPDDLAVLAVRATG